MVAPSRLYAGLSTERIGTPLANFPLPNPFKSAIYANDFFTYAAGDWTVVAGGAGSATALTTGVGGKLLITAATSGTEAITGNAGFNFSTQTSAQVTPIQTWFEANVTLDATVANPDYAIGLTAGALTTLNSATDGVYFTKATTATVWSLVIKAAAGTTTTIALPASTVPTASQTVDLAYYYNGKGLLSVYFNKVLLGTVGAGGSLGTGTAADLANLPAATIFLAPTLLNAWHTATSTLTCDYLLAAVDIVR